MNAKPVISKRSAIPYFGQALQFFTLSRRSPFRPRSILWWLALLSSLTHLPNPSPLALSIARAHFHLFIFLFLVVFLALIRRYSYPLPLVLRLLLLYLLLGMFSSLSSKGVSVAVAAVVVVIVIVLVLLAAAMCFSWDLSICSIKLHLGCFQWIEVPLQRNVRTSCCHPSTTPCTFLSLPLLPPSNLIFFPKFSSKDGGNNRGRQPTGQRVSSDNCGSST